MTKDQALKMALEALEAEKNNYLYNPKLSNAITAIKQALEQPEQELVATVKSWTNGSHWRNYELEWYKDVPEGTKLFTNPAPAQPELDASTPLWAIELLRGLEAKPELASTLAGRPDVAFQLGQSIATAAKANTAPAQPEPFKPIK